jgi:hypothetical protein
MPLALRSSAAAFRRGVNKTREAVLSTSARPPTGAFLAPFSAPRREPMPACVRVITYP